MLMPRRMRRWRKSSTMSSAICLISAGDRLVKTMVSSTRFKNSGRKSFLSSAMTDLRMSVSDKPCLAPPKPRPVSFEISRAPTLLVMMMMVLRKSTLRPWESVRRPSSRICRRILKTSGWAFSISSKRMTE